MKVLKRFEDLICWQKARVLANSIYALTKREGFSKDFGLRNQMRRAAGSVMHNIAEGFDAGSKAEFMRFLKIARRSASEIQSHLFLANDCGYINKDSQTKVNNESIEVKKLINGLIKHLLR